MIEKNTELSRFTAIVRQHETEDARSFQIECDGTKEGLIQAVEHALLQDMIADQMATEDDGTDVVVDRGYDLNCAIKGWHDNIFDRMPSRLAVRPK